MRRTVAALALFATAFLPAGATEAPAHPHSVLMAPYAHFAFDLLREVRPTHPNENVFLSPASVAVALAMTANGAAGKTRAAILQTLHASNVPFADFNAANRALVERINDTKSVQLSMANALWIQEGLQVKPAFTRTVNTEYRAQVANLDFRSLAAVHAINTWAKEHTNGRIDKVVETIDPSTVVMLANAIAFKGKWTLQFSPKETREHPFTTAAGSQIQVPMMSHNAKYAYAENDSEQAIRLPYSDGDFSMYVVLPRTSTSLDTFLRDMNSDAFTKLVGTLTEREGTIELPRFQIEFNTVLNKPLEKLGMSIAFGDGADFSNVHQPPPPLAIDQVRHSSFLKVDEEGTEAAAVTTVGIKALSVIVGPPPFHMVVDHPFFLAIQNDRTGDLLFVGTIANPTH